MTVSVGSSILAADYNAIKDSIARILNDSVGGYGPNLLAATTATTNMTASAQHWGAVYEDVNRCVRHQTGASIPGLAPPAANLTITAADYNTLYDAANTAVANSSTVHPSQLDSLVTAESVAAPNWDGVIRKDQAYSWDSSTATSWFFNLGGRVETVIDYSGDPNIIEDFSYRAFVESFRAQVAPVTFDRSDWTSSTAVKTVVYSTGTDVGIFTATVQYTKNATGVASSTTIQAPDGIVPIQLTAINSSTVLWSVDAVQAPVPTVVGTTKILLASIESGTFEFAAGTRSLPQILTLNSAGIEAVTVTNVVATSNGVEAYVVNTATNLAGDIPVVFPLTFPFEVPAGDSVPILVYYTEPIRATTEIGTFNNSITVISNANNGSQIVNTTQIVTAPNYEFDLLLVDYAQTFTYVDWQTEWSLTDSQRNLGIAIANRYYLPNTNFGVIDGVQRWGLFRKPDSAGLRFWVDYVETYLGGNPLLLDSVFFAAVDGQAEDLNRSRTADKAFDGGFGYGDFYDRNSVNTNVSGSARRDFLYLIRERFGSRTAYVSTLTNQSLNASPDSTAVAAFSVVNRIDGPLVTFDPTRIITTGTYSTDLTVTVTAQNLSGVQVISTQTVSLSLNVISVTDGNLVQWLSGFENDNAVMGISYDRINGQLHLTVGLGSGGDGSPELSAVNYATSFVDINSLGISGDERWGTFSRGRGLPQYKTSYDQWGDFMNTYAVWPYNPPLTGPISQTAFSYPPGVFLTFDYEFTAPNTDVYTVELSADNVGSIAIDDTLLIELSPGDNWSSPGAAATQTQSLSAGLHKITLRVFNGSARVSNPGGIAVRIRNSVGTIVWSTLNTVRTAAPYLYWREVYRIPIETGAPATYQLGDYLVKNAFGVDLLPTGVFKYSDYFGTASTSSAGSLMRVISDGRGNLEFAWNSVSAVTGVAAADRTINGIAQLPFYWSYFTTRKRNVSGAVAGPNTNKLVGITPTGVRTVVVNTPGFALPEQTIVTSCAGIFSTGGGPSPVPGRQFNVVETQSVALGSWAPVSRRWVADQDTTGSRAYSWLRALAFKHPNSTITNQQLEQWGFDPSDVFAARNIVLFRIQTVCDFYMGWGYAIMDQGMSSVVDARDHTELYSVVDGGAGRGTYDVTVNVPVPDPGPNELIYFWINDNQTGKRGSHNNLITVKFNPVLPFG